MEFGCGGYGGHALANAQARGQSERGDGKAREEARAARLSLQKGAGDATGQTTRQAARCNGGCALCMVATPWTRAAHWGILPSTWRAAV